MHFFGNIFLTARNERLAIIHREERPVDVRIGIRKERLEAQVAARDIKDRIIAQSPYSWLPFLTRFTSESASEVSAAPMHAATSITTNARTGNSRNSSNTVMTG